MSKHRFVLLKGQSGAGKTTIMNAIVWCLYGCRSYITERGVSGQPKTKPSTEVRINIPEDLTVVRATKPNRVEATHNGDTYTGDYAQALIDSLYGPYSVFSNTSYISQGDLCAFVNLSGSSKYSMLESILFSDNSNLHMRISSDLRQERQTYDKLQDHVERLRADYEKGYNSLSANIDRLEITFESKPYTTRRYKQQLDRVKNKRQRIENELKARTEIESRISSYNKQLQDLREQLPSDFELEEQLYSQLVEDRISKEKQLELAQSEVERYNTLETSIHELDEHIRQLPSTTSELSELRRNHHLLEEKQQFTHTESLDELRSKCNNLQDMIHSYNTKNKQFKSNKQFTDSEMRILTSLTNIDVLANLSQAVQAVNKDLPLPSVEVNEEQLESDIRILNTLKTCSTVEFISISKQDLIERIKSSKEEKQELEAKLSKIRHELLVMSQSLICPNCNTYLTYQKGDLVQTPTIGSNLKQQKRDIEKQLYLLTLEADTKRLNIVNALEVDTMQATDSLDACIQRYSNSVTKAKSDKKTYNNTLTTRQRLSEIRGELPKVEVHSELMLEDQSLENLCKLAQKYNTYKPSMTSTHDMHATLSDLKTKIEEAKRASSLLPYAERLSTINSELTTDLSLDEVASYIKVSESRQKLESKRQEYRTALTKLSNSTDLPELQQQIDILKSRAANAQKTERYNSLSKDIRSIEHEINELNTSYNSLSSNSESLSVIEKEEEQAQANLDSAVEYNNAVKSLQTLKPFYESLQSNEKELQDLTKSTSNRAKLLKVVEETRIAVLSSSLEELSLRATNLARHMFSSNIDIVVNPTKSLKTKSVSKPEVSITVTYKGIQYTSMKSLSGGEQARVSLALCLAIHSLLPYSHKILLLDEALASLDEEHRDEAVNTMKTYCSDRCLVVSVLHECDEGLFDQVKTL